MDEQVSWKGQSFTLLVFGGIVFLCSVFFVLGMLVGRGQGKSAAESAVVNTAVKAADSDTSKDSKSTIAPYESITTSKETYKEVIPSPTREPEPAKSSAPAPVKAPKPAPKTAVVPAPEPPKASPPKAAPAKGAPAKTAPPAPVKMIYLQVNAVGKDSAANKQVEDLRKAGFQAVVMGGDGPNTLYKVQVGPFANVADADAAKRKLEALGYKPIRK